MRVSPEHGKRGGGESMVKGGGGESMVKGEAGNMILSSSKLPNYILVSLLDYFYNFLHAVTTFRHH